MRASDPDHKPENADDRNAFDLIMSQQEYGRPFALPPNVPADRVQALRNSFTATMQDEDFRAEAKQAHLWLDSLSAEAMEDLIKAAYASPPATIQRAKAILAQALDGRVAGDLKGGGNHCYVGGPDPRHPGETFIFYEYPAGGTGGFDGGDGSNTVRAWTESDMTTLQPIEAVEQLYPVRIERTALREDSGGPGQWRGGLGLTREVRIQTVGAQLSVLAEKAVLPPFGVCGGGAGATNRFWVRRDGRRVETSPLPGKVSGFPLEPGDVLLMESSGGGGFGDPLERDPARVAADVGEGYVTAAAAEAIYGVVLRAGAPDAAATEARRSKLHAARLRVRVVAAPGLDSGRGREVRLSADVARRISVEPGSVVELVNPRGAPLRAWVASLTARSAGVDALVAELAPIALRMLAVADDDEVIVRAVHTGVLTAPDSRRT